MEIFIFWLIVGMAASKMTLLELPFTLRGKYPPSHEYRMAKLRARTNNGGRSVPRTGVGRYFSGLLHDASEQAHAKRSAKHQVKRPYKVRKAEDRTRDRMERRTARQADRKARRSSAESDPGDPTVARTATGPGESDLAERTGFPETTEGDPQAARPVPVAVPHRTAQTDLPDEPDTSISSDQIEVSDGTGNQLAESAPTGEVFSLTQAIEYCELLGHTLRGTCRRIEAMYDTLHTTYKVDGPALDQLGVTWSATDAAADEIEAAGKELSTRLVVKDSYSNVEGPAGTEEFLKEGSVIEPSGFQGLSFP